MMGSPVRQPMTTSSTILILLLLLPVMASSTSTTETCPMNVYEPAPEGFRLKDDILLAGNPEQRYLPSQYRRRIDGHGYEVCSCIQKPCVIKCCKPNKLFIGNKCSISNETHEEFAVSSIRRINPARSSFLVSRPTFVAYRIGTNERRRLAVDTNGRQIYIYIYICL
jgi:hypothetical protein